MLTLRFSGRARRLTVRVVPPDRIEVVIPPRTSRRHVERFVHEHRDWIRGAWAELRRNFPEVDCGPPALIHLLASGEQFRVQYGGLAVAGCGCRQEGDTLHLPAREHIDEPLLALRVWLRRRAEAHLGRLLEEQAEATGLGFRRLQIRLQRTRWGSYSRAGTVSLNAALMFLRPALVRYVLLHELCHQRHMNHSRRFWHLLEGFEPASRRLDEELTEAWFRLPGWLLKGLLRPRRESS